MLCTVSDTFPSTVCTWFVWCSTHLILTKSYALLVQDVRVLFRCFLHLMLILSDVMLTRSKYVFQMFRYFHLILTKSYALLVRCWSCRTLCSPTASMYLKCSATSLIRCRPCLAICLFAGSACSVLMVLLILTMSDRSQAVRTSFRCSFHFMLTESHPVLVRSLYVLRFLMLHLM